MNKVKLKDITLSITDGKHGDCEAEEQSGYYFISCKDVYDGKIHYDGAREITKRDFSEANKRTMLAPNDIIITNSGTIGRMALIKESPKTYRTTFQKSVAIVKPNIERVLPEYLYYQLQNCVSLFVNRANGSAQKNLLLSTMREFDILVHESIDDQRKLAEILSTYDNLIENNQKQIKLLEEAAQRLYKEWFVDLRFPRHETTPIVDGVPEEWKKNRADSFFDITIGKTPPRSENRWFCDMHSGIPWISIADMGSANTFIFETSEGLTEEAVKRNNVKVIPSGTVVVSFKLTVGRVSITTSDMCTNEAIAHFRANDGFWREYTYCYLKEFPYNTLGSTSSISKAVNSKIIKAMPFVLPSQPILKDFSETVRPIFDSIKVKQSQNIYLREARDRLLPKLMSGEIEV